MKKIFAPTEETFPKTSDAVVIGGGIVGTATAFWLSRAGLDTVLVEMREGLSTLTTPNSIESFRAQFTEPTMAELAIPSIEIFENFAEIIGIPDIDIDIHHQGYLFVTDDAEMIADVKAAVETHHSLGVTDSEYLSGDEVRQRFPYISQRAVAATFRQKDGWLSTHEATQGFAHGSSARFLVSTKATGITQDAQGVSGVETNRGHIATRVVVNAAGPFAGVVGDMLDLELPLWPVRRQKAYITPRATIPPNAPLSIDISRDSYWRPETGGALIGWVDPNEPKSAPSEYIPTDRYFAAQNIEKLLPLFPFWEEIAENLKASDVITSAGHYVYTPDDQPLIGPVPEAPGFYLNCGYWAGVMLSPAAGKRIADLVTGEMKPEDNPLRPTRYEEGIKLEGSSFLRGH
ncbi:MAG: FAD-binding oxidoreductase [Chloroflexota bacterium]|nr:FAD-binding oxidoreductase [Chloroflexota bacterium]